MCLDFFLETVNTTLFNCSDFVSYQKLQSTMLIVIIEWHAGMVKYCLVKTCSHIN